MKDFIDILADRLEGNKNKDDILRLVELLYFNHIRSSWRSRLDKTEAHKIAQDVILLENGVVIHSTIKGKDKELKSNTIKRKFDLLKDDKNTNQLSENYSDYFMEEFLTPKAKSTILAQILGEYRYYVTAIMITELILDEKRKIRNGKIISASLTLIVTLIAAFITAFGAYFLLIASSPPVQKNERNENSANTAVHKEIEKNVNSVTQ